MLVEGRHFPRAADPYRLGHKALAVNLSDMAAVGARPRYALLAGALPTGDSEWLASFMHGFDALASRHGVELIGGDTTKGPLTLCVTIIGDVPKGCAITRSGAKPDDVVYVSGTIGEAALALEANAGRVTVDERTLRACAERLEVPTPRVELGVALRGVASSALDVSDGLVGDLGHILDASHVGATVDVAAIPTHPALRALLSTPDRPRALACLLAGGDDYELCFTATPAAQARVAEIAQSLALPVTAIGRITSAPGLVVRDEAGNALSALPHAFDHFT
jgi:thiamine-monophosphate kinase